MIYWEFLFKKYCVLRLFEFLILLYFIELGNLEGFELFVMFVKITGYINFIFLDL